jgi:hypothetical protein
MAIDGKDVVPSLLEERAILALSAASVDGDLTRLT